MKHIPADGLLPKLNDIVGQLLRAHGVESKAQGEWLVFPHHPFAVNAQIVSEIENPKALILQLDVRLKLPSGAVLIESFAGWGPDVDTAVKHALEQFTSGTLHVLLMAFFHRPVHDHANHEDVIIGGRARWVTSGNVTIMGRVPETAPVRIDMAWHTEFIARLKAKDLSADTHWIRLYYCQMAGKVLACELLLDNVPWTEFQTEMAGIDWPKSDNYYSVRLFLVIQNEAEKKDVPIGHETCC